MTKYKANKLNTVAPTSRMKSWVLRPGFWGVLVVSLVVLGVAGFLGFRQVKINNEKQEFLQKQSQIESLADRVAGILTTELRLKDQYCEYQNRKYEKGDLYCSVEEILKYPDVEIDSANEKYTALKILTGLDFKPSGSFTNRFNEFKESSFDHEDQGMVAYINSNSKFCNIGIYYDTGQKSSKEMTISLFCKKVANGEHFPVR